MTARRPRPPRHRPLLNVPVRGWSVTVYVRTGPRPGQYEVDPGFAPTPDGGLHRAGDSTRAIGRRAAVRAAQHAARRHKKATEPPGRVPTGATLPLRPSQASLHHPPSETFGCSLSRHRNGTYVLASPTFVYGDEWRHWTEYAYRDRHTAVAAFQWGLRYVPSCESGRAFRKTDTPIA